jgi:hypothetical protein
VWGQPLADQLVRLDATEPVEASGVDVFHPELHGAAQYRDGRRVPKAEPFDPQVAAGSRR